ncbi:hypothetical protein RvVAR0630_pl06540 (plasmid) [Agrobacterium vitis]|nr:hypothetical protein RvVAR0630_pl06540 [Agrobacterium vitis]
MTETQQSFVTVEGIPIATVGDVCLCTGVPTDDSISSGSILVSIEGKKVARIGDSCSHGGQLIEGIEWVTFD